MPPSPKQNNIDQVILEQFIRDLESTSEALEKLLDQVQESSIDLAAHKTELRILCEEVRRLSNIVRGEGGISLVTRMALIEQRMQELEKDWQEKKHEEKSDRKSLVEVQLADKQGKWKVYTLLVTGVIGIITTVVTFIVQNFK